MKKSMQKLLSAVLGIAILMCLCAPVASVFATGEELTEVTQWNLVLGDQISANFHIRISQSVSSSAVMNVTDGYGTTSYAIADAEKDASGNYVFTARLPAAQLTDTITLQLRDGENVSTAHSYCAVDYAKNIMNSDSSDSTKTLVKAMLNYGAAAQNYFNYNTGNLANTGFESTEEVEIPAVDTSNIVSGNVNGITFYGASLVFESKIAVRFYFNVTGNISDYSFSAGTPVAKDGRYYVEIANINPQDYANPVSVTVNDTLTVNYSPLTYISRMANSENAAMAQLVKAMYQYYQAAVEYQKGEAFEGAEGKSITLNNESVLQTLSFDYKIVSGNKFNISLLDEDWSNGYGYYAFNASGTIGSYDGVSTEELEDGYIRVTFEISALTALISDPNAVIDVLYIRGGDWSDANGYVKNIDYTVYQSKDEFEGGVFEANTGATISLDNDQAVTRMTFDYTIESGEYFHIALMPDWDSFFGYFKFDANGAVGSYAGVVTQKLAERSFRVYIDLTAVTTMTGTPSNVLNILYIRGDWTTANGSIRNICINEAAQTTPRGQEFTAGTSAVFDIDNTVALQSVTFEYKITSGETFALALLPDWSSYFGYFNFNAHGAANSYAGVTTETLDDGYIRVTIDLDSVTTLAGTPSKIIDFLYIRDNWTTANGYIDNITYTVYQPKQEFEGGDFAATTDATFVLDNDQAVTRMTFDYKIDSGEYFHIALMPDWNSFFGYFKFDTNGASGNYAGVVTQKLADGSIRVYVDLTTVTTLTGTPSNVLTMLFVRGNWTTANGTISNICINDAAEYAPRGELLAKLQGKNFVLQNSSELTTLSFDYKIVSGDKFAVALMPDWSSYFGYFNFNANGSAAHNGISTEMLEDGYIRVTFDIANITAVAGSPSKVITMLYVRSDYCDADVYIDNIQFS